LGLKHGGKESPPFLPKEGKGDDQGRAGNLVTPRGGGSLLPYRGRKGKKSKWGERATSYSNLEKK